MKLIIIDRDGVINFDSDEYIKNSDEWEPIPGSVEAIANFSQAGYKVVICTNQSGIGRKIIDIVNLNEIHSKMNRLVRDAGGTIDAIIVCPHRPEDNCSCRKPKPGMILDICERFNIDDINKVMMIGDNVRDLQAIHSAGGIPVLVKTGGGKKVLSREKIPPGTLVYDNLLAASEHIANEN